MRYLVTVHIGPVQWFMVSARRSRDLWFGSWLLSELAKAAAYSLAQQYGVDCLIFPAPQRLEELAPHSPLQIANRIVALLPAAPVDLDHLLRQPLFDRLGTLAEETLDGVDQQGGATHYDRSQALAQIRDLPELFWVMHPVADEGEYARARRACEAAMAARKNTRAFFPPAWTAQVPKSSLDGQRESVIFESSYPALRASAADKRKRAAALYRRFRARPGERLSGVDLLKRIGNPAGEAAFPSTSHVAALPFLARLAQMQGDFSKVREQYIKTLRDNDVHVDLLNIPPHPIFATYDGAILSEGWLTAELPTDEQRQAAIQALQDFFKAALPEDPARPQPYYALLVGDGDFMGSVIDAQTTPAAHQNFSQRLREFALGVGAVVNARQGALVYAGGDDVLAFLPLHTALTCAQALAQQFQEKLAGFCDAEGRSPTFSAGLVIAHHLEPLSDVMARARTAERTAKQFSGKNALALVLSKRSGADRTLVGRWDTLCPRLQRWTQALRQGQLGTGAAYELQRLALRFQGTAEPQRRSVLLHEATRILQRKQVGPQQQALDGQTIAQLLEPLAYANKGEPDQDLVRLAQEIMVAGVLAAAEDLAQTPHPQPA